LPAGRIDQSLYLGPFTSIEAMNATTLYKPGELGSQIQTPNGKAYQLIQVDSGAAASTAGAPVCGTVMFWKSRANYIVTNDKLQAEGAINTNTAPNTVTIANAANSVAGVMCSLTSGAAGTATVTSGNYGVIQQRGQHVGVASDASFIPGDILVAKQTVATSVAARVAVNTALVSQVIGRATAATSQVTSGYTPAVLGGLDLIDV